MVVMLIAIKVAVQPLHVVVVAIVLGVEHHVKVTHVKR